MAYRLLTVTKQIEKHLINNKSFRCITIDQVHTFFFFTFIDICNS